MQKEVVAYQFSSVSLVFYDKDCGVRAFAGAMAFLMFAMPMANHMYVVEQAQSLLRKPMNLTNPPQDGRARMNMHHFLASWSKYVKACAVADGMNLHHSKGAIVPAVFYPVIRRAGHVSQPME